MEINHAALQAELQEIDTQGAAFAGAPVEEGAPEVQEQPIPLNKAEIIIGTIGIALQLLVPAFPSLVKVYTQDTIVAIVDVTVPLADKYGIDLSNVFGRLEVEMRFALVMAPVAMATYKAVKRDIEARQAAAAEAAKQAEEGGGGTGGQA